MKALDHLTGMSRLGGVAVAALMIVVAGCSAREERMLFDGNYYPADSGAVSQDRLDFTASVTRASQGMDGAQRATVHEATRYCVNTFGTSRIDWANVPAGSDGPAFARNGDRVSASGRCVIW